MGIQWRNRHTLLFSLKSCANCKPWLSSLSYSLTPQYYDLSLLISLSHPLLFFSFFFQFSRIFVQLTLHLPQVSHVAPAPKIISLLFFSSTVFLFHNNSKTQHFHFKLNTKYNHFSLLGKTSFLCIFLDNSQHN